MILERENFLSEWELNYFLSLYDYKNEQKIEEEGIYKFYYNNLIETKLKTNTFSKFNFKKFRIQRVDETIQQVENFHRHSNPWSFVIFLNKNYQGGNLIFKDIKFRAEPGKILYFSGEELHRVENCKGSRFTLVGFMNNNPLNVIDTRKKLV